MFNYTCLNPIAQVGLDELSDQYQKVEDINDADAVLVRSAAMHDMEFSDKLCAIARAGAGVNNIPLDKCADQGIVVFNTPGANANGVKELVLCGMLLAARDIAGGMEWVKENASDENIGKAMEKAKKQFAGTELKGKKFGVIGLGAIGVLVANVARHLGMDVYGVDPFLSVKNALSLSRDITVVKSYDELYEICDYITVHVPYIPDTKGMLNKEAFAKMKDGVILINCARGGLTDIDALVDGVESEKIGALGMDTVEGEEGIVHEDRRTDIISNRNWFYLHQFRNVIMTQHMAFYTKEAVESMVRCGVEGIVQMEKTGSCRTMLTK